jgi:hypothetical protein
LGFTPVQQGGGAGQSTNKLYIGWSGSDLLLQVDASNFGNYWPIHAKAPTVYYPGLLFNENASWNVPSDCIQVWGYFYTVWASNTAAEGYINLRDSSLNTVNSYTIGISSGNDGGSASNWTIPFSVPIASNITSMSLTRKSGGNVIYMGITGYATR